MSARKENPATSIVTRAQKAYPKLLASSASYFGSIPYGMRKLSTETADKRLAQMLPEDFAQLAATNPQQALAGKYRLAELEQRSANQTPLPAQGDYEGDQ